MSARTADTKKRALENASELPKECPVCCETFTLHARKPVACANCDYVACVSCNKTFLLSSESDPKCMHCNHPWNREFLETFPKTWINGEVRYE